MSVIDDADREIKAILDKYDVKLGFQMNFPYDTPPDDVKLAIAVLLKHGLKVSFTIEKK